MNYIFLSSEPWWCHCFWLHTKNKRCSSICLFDVIFFFICSIWWKHPMDERRWLKHPFGWSLHSIQKPFHNLFLLINDREVFRFVSYAVFLVFCFVFYYSFIYGIVMWRFIGPFPLYSKIMRFFGRQFITVSHKLQPNLDISRWCCWHNNQFISAASLGRKTIVVVTHVGRHFYGNNNCRRMFIELSLSIDGKHAWMQ